MAQGDVCRHWSQRLPHDIRYGIQTTHFVHNLILFLIPWRPERERAKLSDDIFEVGEFGANSLWGRRPLQRWGETIQHSANLMQGVCVFPQQWLCYNSHTM
jgi:hypothetical protein